MVKGNRALRVGETVVFRWEQFWQVRAHYKLLIPPDRFGDKERHGREVIRVVSESRIVGRHILSLQTPWYADPIQVFAGSVKLDDRPREWRRDARIEAVKAERRNAKRGRKNAHD